MPISSKPTKAQRRRRRERKGQVLSLATLAVMLSLAGGLVWLSGATAIRSTEGVGGPFRLVDSAGKIVTDRDFRGKYLLVYFGYTSCPDLCPTTLSDVSDALQQLGSHARRVQPVFITVDPARDTSERLKAYLASFSPLLIGLTGSPAEIAAVERAYHASSAQVRSVQGGSGYSVNHSAALYLMGRHGEFISAFPAMESAKALAVDIERYLS
jgi:protein SCO1/2